VETSAYSSAAGPSMAVIGADEDTVYRTLSVMSLISLCLGLAAPLCLVAPLLYAIPIAGTAVALVALRQIATSDGALIGRKAALVALALCVACGSYPVPSFPAAVVMAGPRSGVRVVCTGGGWQHRAGV
jgi:hypothetical protein